MMAESELFYNFNNDKRGIALLIHNEEFDRNSGYKDRPGDEGDFTRMSEMFRSLGFEVRQNRNLTATKIREESQRVASLADVHKKSDCFVCVIASHGEEMLLGRKDNVKIKEHVIIGTDGKGVKTKDLVEMFDNDHCEELKDKPKFFFIQACRTSKDTIWGMDRGHTITVTDRIHKENTPSAKKSYGLDSVVIDDECNSDYELDSKHSSSVELHIQRRPVVHQVTNVDCPEDTLLMFASMSDNFAVRNAETGGWLLTSLYSQVKQGLSSGEIWRTEFIHILNRTLKEMTTKNFKPADMSSPLYGAFSLGCLTHSLTKDVIFTKKT